MKQFCRHGHDTFVVGRDSNGRCKRCVYEYRKGYYKAHRDLHNRYKRAWRRHRKIAAIKAAFLAAARVRAEGIVLRRGPGGFDSWNIR